MGTPEDGSINPRVRASYVDWAGKEVVVPPADLAAVSATLGPAPGGDHVGTLVTHPGEQLPPPGSGTVVREDGQEQPYGAALPLGYHRVHWDGGGESTVICAPHTLDWPDPRERLVGWQVQLYQLRSARSWGLGDYADLATFLCWAAARGAGAVLVNPLHAGVLLDPATGRPRDSPYSPTSRRFLDVLSIAPDLLPEAEGTDLSDWFAEANVGPQEPMDRGRAWRAKSAALQHLFERSTRDVPDDPALRAFAFWCADHYGGTPEWHAWLQVVADEQLRAATAAAPEVRLILDIAVGVDAGSADAELLADELADGATIGAPLDSFNPLGQDWNLPPLHPDRLAETGMIAWREVVQSVAARAGGLRLDHVMGLSRLWFVTGPGHGAYVDFDLDAMLAVVLLEARRAGAFVVGEDLGTVEVRVREALDGAGVLGSDVLWFLLEEGTAPEDARRAAVATVTTHDLPTVAGFLGDHSVELRGQLGLLADLEEERARLHRTRDALLDLCRDRGWLELEPPGDKPVTDTDEMRQCRDALHRAILASPARVVLASLGDALGDRRQPNLPGTGLPTYPSWCLLLAGPDGRPLLLEEVLEHPDVLSLARLLASG